MNYFFNMSVYRLSSEKYYEWLNDYKNKYYIEENCKMKEEFYKRNTNIKRTFENYFF